MVEDTGKDYRDTMQEIMFDLKLKSSKLLKKFKMENKKKKVTY